MNLDLLFSIFIILIGSIILYLSLFEGIGQQGMAAAFILGGIVYLIKRDDLLNINNDRARAIKHLKFDIFNMLFIFNIIILLYFSLFFLYNRSFYFFIILTFAYTLICIEIIYKHKIKSYNIITKILILSLCFKIGNFYLFPSILGTDTLTHLILSQSIIKNFIIKIEFYDPQYIYTPLFHLLVSISTILLNVDIKTGLLLSFIIPFSFITTIIFYFFMSKIFNIKVALIGSVLINVSDMFLLNGLTNITTGSLVICYFLIILYFFYLKNDNIKNNFIILINITAIILTHQLTTFVVLVILVIINIGIIVYSKLNFENFVINKYLSNFNIYYIIYYIVLLIFVWL
jgi:hypothetical protein